MMVHHCKYPLSLTERCIYKKIRIYKKTQFGLGGDAFTRATKVTQKVAQYPLHHVTFEVAVFNGLQQNILFDL